MLTILLILLLFTTSLSAVIGNGQPLSKVTVRLKKNIKKNKSAAMNELIKMRMKSTKFILPGVLK